MTTRISPRWLVILFLQCLIGAGLEAQSFPASCLAYPLCQGSNQWSAACVPALPPGVFNCSSSGFAEGCQVATSKCTAICWDCLFGTPSGGAPINLATGDTFIAQSDLSIPGLGGGLSLSRTWHSLFPFTESVPTSGMFGGNWRSTYEESIFVSPGGLVKYVRGTGGIWTLGLVSLDWPLSYAMVAPANGNLSLGYDGTFWTLTYNTGEKRIFNAAGYLLSMSDRNGNTTQLTYDASNRLTTVTDPASRHLYFSYASPSSNLVVGVSSDVGISLTYAYDGQGRLATVTKPDLTTISFQYDSNSLISAVLDTNGNVLESHTYDGELRGLTSSRAGGVDAITITFPFLFPGP
jgi:YD repeat-containing protein